MLKALCKFSSHHITIHDIDLCWCFSLWFLTKIVDDDDDNEWKQDVQLKYLPWVRAKDLRVKYEQYERTLQNYITLYQDYTSIHIFSQNHIILYQDYIIQYKYIYFRSCQDYTTLYNYTLEGPLRTISHFTPWLHHAVQLYIFKFLSEQLYFYSGLSYSIDTVCVYTQMHKCTIRIIITAMW